MNEKGATFDYRGVLGVPYPGIHQGSWKEKSKRVSDCVVWKRRDTAGKPGVKRMGEQET